MFSKLLIANRGEIARRINAVARGLGIHTVAVYSDADAGLPHVKEASQAVRLGPAPARDSYLNIPALVEAALSTGCQAVHPGYGFVSESAELAQAMARAGVVFVGPSPETFAVMKDKSQARALVARAGVPIVPGSEGVVADVAAALAEAERLGYPVLCKAAGGGGGIGMQVATTPAELEKAFRACTDRARSAFGREGVYLERYFAEPRHIEVQILGDGQGTTLHLLERECSIQRRHQKVLEEAGSPLFLGGANAPLRERLFDAALKAARAFGYSNAGTVEFLAAEGQVYFIEMNARLQVEHPVTEVTTGVDLITWQLRIAAGEKLTLTQAEVKRTGHALELRVYAEDPVRFLPSPGTLSRFELPSLPNVRLDAGYAAGDAVTPHYDPLLAKLIVWDADRPSAIRRATEAVERFSVEGLKHNLPLHQRILRSEAFARGDLSTRFLERHARP